MSKERGMATKTKTNRPLTRNERRQKKKVLLKMLEQNMKERSCGGCTACCTVMGVAELNKPNHVACEHVTDSGCSIYEQRPKSCKEFQCMWRIGICETEERPDKSGLVIDTTRPGGPLHPAFIVREVWPGAFDDSQHILMELASKTVIVLVAEGKPRRVLGPEDRMMTLRPVIMDMMKQLNDGAYLQ